MTDYKWEVGTIFADKANFIEAIRTYVVHTGRALKFVKNDKHRVRVRCMGGQGKCPWTAYCGYLPTRPFWQLRKIMDTHSCSRQLNIKIMNTKWLSEEIDRFLQDNPNLKVQDIRQKDLRKWNTKISISKARRAKLMATRQLIGDFKEQYRRIHDYGHELLRSNPGSTVKVEVDSVNGETVFKRFYVCLKGCKESFVSCRRIICLDGCFLKGQHKGELLTAIGRDPNDQMLPLAYAIVEVENKETWSWFLQLLIADLGGNEVCGRCTWMSDQQKGLVHAIEELLLKADQRFCMRHLYANFGKQFPGQTLRTLMWKAATSTYPQAWEREMLNIKQVNIEAYKYLISIPPAMNYCNEDPKKFIPSCFTRTTYEATYAAMIYPINGQMLWEKTSFVDVLPPVIRKMPGRPKKKRKLEAWELTKDATQMNIGGHRKKCTICRKLGHNRSKYPLHPPITEPTCPSDSQTQIPNLQSPQPPQPTQESSAHSTPPIMRKKLPFKRRMN
ncbi:uncharacterized protein LOC106760697 [Vigna radiata var. radiata]|uniref:Uncharacterized protein LOC106760697 n=1 Tax=Vigna radiata var. radiata TaxID=3916 RepID=A0A1S3U0Q6_VIGRR|nr:uncharacterized protein LOC106760697 [Vigna radiata var. radiata]